MHDAADGRGPAAVEEPRDNAVGGNHQVLDQRLRAVRQFGRQVAQRLSVEAHAHFGELEIERAEFVPMAGERLREAVLEVQLLAHARCPGVRRQRPATRESLGGLGILTRPSG